MYRVFLNLIKNSEDSFAEKAEKNSDFKGKIDIEITSNNDYITILFSDNGTGIKDTKQVMTPYYTTKSNAKMKSVENRVRNNKIHLLRFILSFSCQKMKIIQSN